MSSKATKAYASIIAYSTDDVTYVDIVQTIDLAGPSPEQGDIKTTNNSSPSNTHEYMPGLIEPGELDFDIVYTKTQANTLYGLFPGNPVYFWRETYPDGSKWQFKAYVKGFGTEGETEDGKLTNTMKLKLTTKPTFTQSGVGLASVHFTGPDVAQLTWTTPVADPGGDYSWFFELDGSSQVTIDSVTSVVGNVWTVGFSGGFSGTEWFIDAVGFELATGIPYEGNTEGPAT